MVKKKIEVQNTLKSSAAETLSANYHQLLNGIKNHYIDAPNPRGQ